MNPFLQLAAEKEDSKNGAARKFLGPSYLVSALVETIRLYWGNGGNWAFLFYLTQALQ